MSRPPGHERSAWATEAMEAQAIMQRIEANQIAWTHKMGHPSRLLGKRAGLAFRAAELVYDAEQWAEIAERTAKNAETQAETLADLAGAYRDALLQHGGAEGARACASIDADITWTP